MRAVAYLTSVVGLSLIVGFALVFGITFRAEVWDFVRDQLPYKCDDILGFSRLNDASTEVVGYRCVYNNGTGEMHYFFPEACKEILISKGKSARIADECDAVPRSRFHMHMVQWRKMLNLQ